MHICMCVSPLNLQLYKWDIAILLNSYTASRIRNKTTTWLLY